MPWSNIFDDKKVYNPMYLGTIFIPRYMIAGQISFVWALYKLIEIIKVCLTHDVPFAIKI